MRSSYSPVVLVVQCLFIASVAKAAVPAIAQVTAAQWATLSSAVGGRLYDLAPIAKPCYS